MTYTERKHCDTCQEETVHVKENLEEDIAEECLPCGWKDWKESVEKDIEKEGLEKAKEWWIETRDGELNKKLVGELNASEKATWFKIVNWTNKKLGFSPKENPWKDEQELNKQPFDYKPWLIGGGIGLIVGILIGWLISKIDK